MRNGPPPPPRAPLSSWLPAPIRSVSSGLMIAGQNLMNQATPPAIVSISYGGCEAENGASSNAAISSLYQQGVAEGVSDLRFRGR